MYSASHGDPELPGYEHRRFLEPLAAKDASTARRVVEAHVLANGRSIIADLAASQQDPEQKQSSATARQMTAE